MSNNLPTPQRLIQDQPKGKLCQLPGVSVGAGVLTVVEVAGVAPEAGSIYAEDAIGNVRQVNGPLGAGPATIANALMQLTIDTTKPFDLDQIYESVTLGDMESGEWCAYSNSPWRVVTVYNAAGEVIAPTAGKAWVRKVETGSNGDVVEALLSTDCKKVLVSLIAYQGTA